MEFSLEIFFKITNCGIFKVYSFLNSSLWSWFFPCYIKKGDISNYTKTCVKSAFEPQNTHIFLKTASFKKKSLISPWCAMVRGEQSDFPSSLLQWFPPATASGKGFHKLVVLPNHIGFCFSKNKKRAYTSWLVTKDSLYSNGQPTAIMTVKISYLRDEISWVHLFCLCDLLYVYFKKWCCFVNKM